MPQHIRCNHAFTERSPLLPISSRDDQAAVIQTWRTFVHGAAGPARPPPPPPLGRTMSHPPRHSRIQRGGRERPAAESKSTSPSSHRATDHPSSADAETISSPSSGRKSNSADSEGASVVSGLRPHVLLAAPRGHGKLDLGTRAAGQVSTGRRGGVRRLCCTLSGARGVRGVLLSSRERLAYLLLGMVMVVLIAGLFVRVVRSSF